VGAIPTLAAGGQAAGTTPPSTASFTAVDYAWEVSGSTATQATIAQGGTVTLGYPTGGSHHNADFGTRLSPTSCHQAAGTDSGSVPPLPHQPTAQGWSGSCVFDTPGTYTFHCDLHHFMTATIVVQGPGTTSSTSSTSSTSTSSSTSTTRTTSTGTTSTTQSSTTGTTSTSPTGSAPTPRPPHHGGSPLAGTAARAIVVASRQRGVTVAGTAQISAAGAGGRLEVKLFTRSAQLQVSGQAHDQVLHVARVGHLVRTALHAGRVRFAVRLDGGARRALLRRRRLRLRVVITLRSAAGERATASRYVVVRP
jgi:hypothetical protein